MTWGYWQRALNTSGSQILRKGHLYHQELIQNALIKFYLELDNVLDRKTNHAEQTVIPSRKDVKLREFITLLMQHFKEEHQVSFLRRCFYT